MGLEVNRVRGEVDEELLCPICSGVLTEPVAAPECEHAFCQPCIATWLARRPTCPVDRRPVRPRDLRPVPRILKNLLARLEVSCDNAPSGCEAVVKLDLLEHHLRECEHNPKRAVSCERGCGLAVPKDELAAHNCLREMRTLLAAQDAKLAEMRTEVADCRYQLAEQRRDISVLKDALRIGGHRGAALIVDRAPVTDGEAAAAANPTPAVSAASGGASGGVMLATPHRTVSDQIQDDEVARWSASLQVARVSRWGGMISTPDASLQTAIRRALLDSGCPEGCTGELMANAHERRWPSGLLTLETRQMNRRHYEQYVCRRIPGKQAVAVMACDNMHMSDDMILEPGLVMIFAHGIE